MASDLNKHKAEMLKITGIAFISPLGRVIIQPFVVFNEFHSMWFFIGDSIWFLLYLLIVIIFAIIGIIVIGRSYYMLR